AFEAIDIADDQTARQSALEVRLDENAMNSIELRSISHLRQRIADRLFVESLAALFERGLGRHVVQHQRHAVDRTVGGGHGEDVRIDGYIAIVAAADHHPLQRLSAGVQGMSDGAGSVEEGLAALVTQLEQARFEWTLEDRGPVQPSKVFRPAIPEHD